MKTNRHADGERTLAVFFDFENIGIGLNHRRDRFEIHKVVERLVEKGKIVAKKAYADWSRFAQYTGPLHEAAIELIEIPRRGVTGKNSADIRLVVDAMDLAYSKEHIDTFVIVSGDSDFSPLVSKLKELGKHVIGLGLAEATSDLLRDNCDEFIYYDDLDKASEGVPGGMPSQIPEAKKKAFGLLIESLLALRRENKEVMFSSMVKDTMKRKKPSFNEEYHGYRTFSELLEDAAENGLIDLERHKGSGTYVVTRFGNEPKMPVPLPATRSARLPRIPAASRPPVADGRPASEARPPAPTRRPTVDRVPDRVPAPPRDRAPAREAPPPRPVPLPGPARKPAPARPAPPKPAPVPTADVGDDFVDMIEDRYAQD